MPPIFDFYIFHFNSIVSFLRACSFKESLTSRHTSLSIKNNRKENTIGMFPFISHIEFGFCYSVRAQIPISVLISIVEGGPVLQDRAPLLEGAVSVCRWQVEQYARPCGYVLGDRYSQGETVVLWATSLQGWSHSWWLGVRCPRQKHPIPLHLSNLGRQFRNHLSTFITSNPTLFSRLLLIQCLCLYVLTMIIKNTTYSRQFLCPLVFHDPFPHLQGSLFHFNQNPTKREDPHWQSNIVNENPTEPPLPWKGQKMEYRPCWREYVLICKSWEVDIKSIW